MSVTRILNNSFVGGELDPACWGRQDVKRYHESAAMLQNFTVQRAGGINKRPGTDLVDSIGPGTTVNATAAGVKITRFRFDRSNAFLLVFVNQLMYVYKNGAAMLQAATGTANFSANPADGDTITVGSQVYRFKNTMAQANDVKRDSITLATTIGHLLATINGTGAAGTDYYAGTITPNASATAVVNGSVLTITANAVGTGGNSIALAAASTAITVSAATLTGGGPFSLATPYLAADVGSLQFQQCGSVIFITHSGYPPATLTANDNTGLNWTYQVISFQITTPSPTGFSAVLTGSSSAPTLPYQYCVSAIVNGQESLPCPASAVINVTTPWPAGTYVTLTWNVVDGAQFYNVYKLQYGTYGLISAVNAATLGSSLGSITWDVPFVLDGFSHYPPLTAFSTTTSLASGYQNNAIINLAGTNIDGTTGSPSYNAQYNVFSSAVNGFPGQQPMAGIGVHFSTPTLVAGVKMAFGANVLTVGGSVVPLGFGATSFQIYGSNSPITNTYDFYGSTLLFTSGTIPSGPQTGLQTFAFPANDNYQYFAIVWPIVNGGLSCLRAVQMIAASTQGQFVDINISPDASNAPTNSVTPWTATTGFPRAMTLFQQRSVWTDAPDQPEEILFSATNNFYCFNLSTPTKSTDYIDLFVSMTDPGRLLHMVAIRNTMIILTETGEWIISYDQTSGLSGTSVYLTQHTYYGCNSAQPLKIANGLLFCHRDGRSLLEYQFQLYTLNNFMANDRSTLARHLTEGKTIVSMAYALAPDSIVWCVLSDGTMLSMTYVPAEQIFAWARHQTGAASSPDSILDSCFTGALVQVNGTDSIADEVYLLVSRGSNLYIERMRVPISSDTPTTAQAVAMDACQRLDLGSPSTTLTPALAYPTGWPLQVVNLNTGAVQAGTANSNGTVTVAVAVQHAMIGIPINASMITLYPDNPQQNIQNIHKNIKTVILRQRRGSDGSITPYNGMLPSDVTTSPLPLPGQADNDATPTNAVVVTPGATGADGTVALNTYDVRVPMLGAWSRQGQMNLLHTGVWPMTILELIYNLELGHAD